MLRNEIMELMEKLKLQGMQSIYDEALSNGRKSRSTPEKIILEMLKAEATERHIRASAIEWGRPGFLRPRISTVLISKGVRLMKTRIQSLYQGILLNSISI